MAKIAKYDFPIVVIEWNDAVRHTDGDTEPRHRAEKLVAVGWLLKRDKTGISYAEEYSANENAWRQEHYIPAAMIASVRVIK